MTGQKQPNPYPGARVPPEPPPLPPRKRGADTVELSLEDERRMLHRMGFSDTAALWILSRRDLIESMAVGAQPPFTGYVIDEPPAGRAGG